MAFANVWKETGWNAIIYLSAITAIDPSLYEAASIDGAGRWAKIRHITFPGIKPTIMILLLMNVGNVLNAGFEVQYLLGNGLVQSVSQTIDIYVLKWGISQGDYAIGTAAGIFKSVVSIIPVSYTHLGHGGMGKPYETFTSDLLKKTGISKNMNVYGRVWNIYVLNRELSALALIKNNFHLLIFLLCLNLLLPALLMTCLLYTSRCV